MKETRRKRREAGSESHLHIKMYSNALDSVDELVRRGLGGGETPQTKCGRSCLVSVFKDSELGRRE